MRLYIIKYFILYTKLNYLSASRIRNYNFTSGSKGP